MCDSMLALNLCGCGLVRYRVGQPPDLKVQLIDEDLELHLYDGIVPRLAVAMVRAMRLGLAMVVVEVAVMVGSGPRPA